MNQEINATGLSDRQRRELEYHREHAREHERLLNDPFSYSVLTRPDQRWWNAYWRMYAYLARADLFGKRVLVVGCGFGEDALRLSRLGAEVYAFDLSPESIAIAMKLAEREKAKVSFEVMAAEKLKYESDYFDCILARDILHHVDIPEVLAEIRRVGKSSSLLVVNEVYSHSLTEVIRRSAIVDKVIYPRMQSFVYGGRKPYITEDERKLTEGDLETLRSFLAEIQVERHFNFLVNRILPGSSDFLDKLDFVTLTLLRPVAHLISGRVFLAGSISK